MSFAPYQPPPDLPPADDGPSKKKSGPKRPWFNRDASSYLTGGGYQSGGSSSQAQTSYSSTAPVLPTHAGPSHGGQEDAAGAANSWETRFGWRVDFESAGAYVLGPVSALLLLILETTNELVRFHAWQSALLTTPLVLLHFLLKLIFPAWLKLIYNIFALGLVAFMAVRAYTDANRGLERYYLPVIGPLAERWIGDE